MIDFSLVIPIYNEEKNIVLLFEKILDSFLINEDTCKYIIFIDDGSKDNSGALIDKYLIKSNKFIKLYHKKNKGYGAALKTAINFSIERTKYIIFIDSDLTNPLIDIKKIIKLMKKNTDYIQANRYLSGKLDISLKRKLIGIIGNIISRIFMGMKIKDYTNGFRAVKIELYSNINLIENDFSIIMEEKYKLKTYIKTIGEFSTTLSERDKNMRETSFNYSLHLVSKYLIYCLLTFTKVNKTIIKIE